MRSIKYPEAWRLLTKEQLFEEVRKAETEDIHPSTRGMTDSIWQLMQLMVFMPKGPDAERAKEILKADSRALHILVYATDTPPCTTDDNCNIGPFKMHVPPRDYERQAMIDCLETIEREKTCK